jgi:hypothetical protein
MNSKQDYINIYRKIATGLDLYGDSAELLIQLLAESTYISEVEHVVYMQEASLEKSTLLNSKIQHCMENMYSVFRGSCPRVILRFTPTKYFDLKPFDELIVGNGFKVYYLGFWDPSSKEENQPGTESVALMDGFVYGPKVIPPSLSGEDVYTLIGLLAKETSSGEWSTSESNMYFVENLAEDLSQDCWVKIQGTEWKITRNFSQHITESAVFDLTLPSFGSRLYVADILRSGSSYSRSSFEVQANVQVSALWYVYSLLSSYNQAELKKLMIKGTVPISFGSPFQGFSEVSPGLILIPESSRDTVSTIHYKANRDRYVNSIIRTNSDIGTVLEETYPKNIKSGGTSYQFFTGSSGSGLRIYYVPQDSSKLLTDEEIDEFRETRGAYYVTSNLNVLPGTRYTAIFNLDLELYYNESIDSELKDLLSTYQYSFGMDLEEKSDEIRALINKISNVKQISGFYITYQSESGQTLEDDEIEWMKENLDTIYYEITYTINSRVQTVGM